ncbi:MAG: glycoside hydrolase family 5 protein [Thiobacillus sp.]|nr:glycoside hydrolase family 5 protein [Thiobacillus sp.]
MTILRGCIGWLAACLLAVPVYAEGMRALTAADFLRQPYRGFTLDNGSSKTAADFDDLAAMGANLVRIGITLERCAKCRDYTIPPKFLLDVDQVLALAEPRGIHLILTLVPERPEHAAYWEDATLQASIVDVWSRLAERYKDKPAMGGFDLINEPNPPGRAKEAHRRYAEFAGRLIEAVRRIDPQRMIVYEPAPRGNTFYAFKELKTPLPYDNVLYSPHFYHPVDITHQGVGKQPHGEPYPTSEWNKALLSERLEPVREFARKYKLPIYMGEFGCVRDAPGDTTYRWIKDVADLLEAEGWSWTFHSFRGWHGWDPELPARAPKPVSAAAAKNVRSMYTPVMALLRGYLNKSRPPSP